MPEVYLVLEIHSEQVFGLVLRFKGLDCLFHALYLSVFVLAILFGSPNLANQKYTFILTI
jgi:hypothetical protein